MPKADFDTLQAQYTLASAKLQAMENEHSTCAHSIAAAQQKVSALEATVQQLTAEAAATAAASSATAAAAAASAASASSDAARPDIAAVEARAADAEGRATEAEARAEEAIRAAAASQALQAASETSAAEAKAAAAAAASAAAESDRQLASITEQLRALPAGQTVKQLITAAADAEKAAEDRKKDYEAQIQSLREQLKKHEDAAAAAAAASATALPPAPPAPSPGASGSSAPPPPPPPAAAAVVEPSAIAPPPPPPPPASLSARSLPVPAAASWKDGPTPTTVDEMIALLQMLGLKSSQLSIFIDCTKSNLTNGAKSFNGRSLHDVSDPAVPNPYQVVIRALGQTLAYFDSDGLIPVYGFGDRHSADSAVFAFHGKPGDPKALCKGLDDVLSTYTSKIGSITLAGPTSFAPAIRKTIEHVKAGKEKEFTFCLIIADGQVTSVKETEAAIVEASKLPISICCVGVGDGPWDEMYRFDDSLSARKFDNFQFVEFNAVAADAKERGVPVDVAFAMAALAEVPEQLAQAKALRMLK